MRKASSNFKIPVSSKTVFYEFTKSQNENTNLRNTMEPSSRRKQSLPSSAKHDAGLMAQIKQALRAKEMVSSDNIEANIDLKLSEAKRMIFESSDASRYTRKQNKSNNHQERETTFKDNLKEMQVEISSLKKLMEYQKARNHKIFEEKLFTVEEKFQEHKNLDDKIQMLRDLMAESASNIARERKMSQEMSQRYVGREEYLELKKEVEWMRGECLGMGEVDKRIGENLEIFKAFFLENIDANILSTIDTRTQDLNQMLEGAIQEIKEQQAQIRELVNQSNTDLSHEITILKEECQTISETIIKEEILKFEDILDDWTRTFEARIETETERLREEWVENIDPHQKRILLLQTQVPSLNLQTQSKISLIKQELSESMTLVNDIMEVVKNLIKKVDSKNGVSDEKIVELIRENTRDIEWVRKQVSGIADEVRYLEERIESGGKCVESNLVTSGCLEQSPGLIIEHSFEN